MKVCVGSLKISNLNNSISYKSLALTLLFCTSFYLFCNRYDKQLLANDVRKSHVRWYLLVRNYAIFTKPLTDFTPTKFWVFCLFLLNKQSHISNSCKTCKIEKHFRWSSSIIYLSYYETHLVFRIINSAYMKTEKKFLFLFKFNLL